MIRTRFGGAALAKPQARSGPINERIMRVVMASSWYASELVATFASRRACDQTKWSDHYSRPFLPASQDSRMSRMVIRFVVVALSFACGFASAAPLEAAAPPNVVLIVGDDWGYTDF